MNNKKTSKKIVSISLLTTSILALGATSIVLNTNQQQNSQQILTNQIQRGTTNNSDPQKLSSPDEVFYSSKDLSTLDVWSNGVENTTNKQYFETLKNNLLSVQGESPAKTSLIKLCDDVANYLKFKEVEQVIKTNNVLNSLWDVLKPVIKEELNAEENFSDIQNLTNANDLFKQMSGISSGELIKEISFKSLSKIDLITQSSSDTIDGGGESVIGKGFKQLIKIATIDLSSNGQYVLDFEYKLTPGTRAAKASLIIKNESGQITNASNVTEIKNNIDIFGRYKDMGTFQMGQASYKQMQEGLIFSKKNNDLEIFVRVGDNDRFSNLQFSKTDAQPKEFGILDVQATNDSTFTSLIGNSGSKKLVDINDSTNTMKGIQFFSDRIDTTKMTSGTSINKNRNFVFYQGIDQDFNMNLNYAQNSSSGDFYSYELLTAYENGANTGTPILLPFVAPKDKPSELLGTYDFYMPLLEDMPVDVKSQFPEISKIELNSILSSDSKLVKQSISFSDKFYGIGNRPSWANVNISGNYQIFIPDLTAKIFFEKPDTYNDSSTTKQSSFSAKEQVDERTQIVSLFSQIYGEWSKPNSGIYNGWTGTFETSVVTMKNNKIQIQDNLVGGSGQKIYISLNEYWSLVSGIMKNVFETGKDYKNRYAVSQSGDASKVISDYLLKNNEYVQQYNEIETIVLDSIKIWKEDKNLQNDPQNSSIEKLEKTTQTKLANNLLKLINIQYKTILNEFRAEQLTPIYKEFIKVFSATSEMISVQKMKAPSEILELKENSQKATLISYKENAWKEVATTETTSIDLAIKSLFELLYFGSATPNGILLGDALFSGGDVASSSFKNLNIDNIVQFNELNSINTKKSQMDVMSSLLNFFGYDLNKSIENMMNNSEKFKLNFDLKEAMINILKNISSTTVKTRTNNLPNGQTNKSYYLDDIIAAANAISSLNFKLSEIENSMTKNSNSELAQRILEILNNQQASSSELSIWSFVSENEWNFDNYSSNFSGRNGETKLNSIYSKVINENTLMKNRYIKINEAWSNITEYLKYVWPVVIALIGVGILATSSVGIITKSKQIKLSSRPILKLLLITGIVLGIVVIALTIVFGILPII